MNCFLLLFVFPRCCFVSFSFCWLWVSFGGAFKMSPRMHASTSNEIVFHFAYFFSPLLLRCYYYFKTHVCRMTKSHRNTNDNHSDNDARSINKNKNKKWEIKIGERTRHTFSFFFSFFVLSIIIIMELFVFYFAAWMGARLISFSMALFQSIWIRMGSLVCHCNSYNSCNSCVRLGMMNKMHLARALILYNRMWNAMNAYKYSGRD